MIIFDEFLHAEHLIKNGITSYMNMRDLVVLARYYRHLGQRGLKLRESILNICLRDNSAYNEVLYGWKIDKCMKFAEKREIRMCTSVPVYKEELDFLNKEPDFKRRKVLFCALVVARYFTPNANALYYNGKFSDLLKLARVSLNRVDKIALMRYFNDTKSMTPTLTGAFLLGFNDSSGDVGVVVDDMNTIVSFLPVVCEKCGDTFTKKSKMHSMCPSCYKQHRKINLRNNTRQFRKNIK